MGRRSTKSSPTTGTALPFDTVGMTILPGRSLPEWAEPAAAAPELSGPELIADAPASALDEAVSQAAEPQAPSQVPEEWAAHAATPQAAPRQTASAPEPALAMAGAGLVGAGIAGAPVASAPAGYGHLDQGYPTEPSRYPAAPAAGLAAMTAAPAVPASSVAGAGQPSGYAPATSAPGQGQGWTATPTPARAPGNGPAPTMTAYGAAEHGSHAGAADQAAMGGLATATVDMPTTGSEAHGVATDTLARAMAGQESMVAQEAPPAAPPTPSETWSSPDRASLSPQHIALLSWWADMIAAGQFPAPPAGASPDQPPASSASKERRTTSFPIKAAVLGLVALVAVGTAAVVGPKVMASDQPVEAPATSLRLPAGVGGLVQVTDPAFGAELEGVLGFGLRPTGVTVAGAYGSSADGPLAMAAMATTMGAPAEAVGQIAAWAERTGATVAPSVTGAGASEGITCAAVEAIPAAQPGSFCVWSATGKRGQTYSVATSVEDAQTLTNQLRTLVTGT